MGKKKQESSSSSSSSESSEKVKQPKKVVPAAKDAKSTPKKPEPKKPEAKAPAKAESDESSSSSSESVKAAPKPAAVLKKEEKKKGAPAAAAAPAKKAAAKKPSSSSSSSASVEEQPKKKKAVEKKAPSSNEEDEEDEKPKKRKAEEEPAAQPPSKKPKTTAPAPTSSNGGHEPTGRVFVGNLPWSIDDDTIKEFFKDCGTISEIHWVMNKQTGKFAGSGFLAFSSPEEAIAAVALAGTEIDGRPVKLEHAQPRAGGDRGGGAGTPRQDRAPREPTPKPEGCTTVFLGNLSFSIDEDTVRSVFADCGEVTAVRWVERDGQFKGCGFVEFAESDATDLAVAKNGQDVLGRPMRVDYSAPKAPKKF
jgi:nucleolin